MFAPLLAVWILPHFAAVSANDFILTQCVSVNWPWPILSCTGNSMLLIERAYTALRTLHDGDNVTAVDRMCASAMSQMEPIDVERKPDDCIIDVDDVTDYVISTCSTFTNCRLTSNTILRINSDEQESKCASIAISHPIISYPYISVDYECTPVSSGNNGNGADITVVYMTSPVSYTIQTNVFYAATSGYPVDWNRGQNRCLVRLPANSSFSLTLLDARARAINSVIDCAYRLTVTGDTRSGTVVFGQWCARTNWTRTTVQLQDTGYSGMQLSIFFDPAPSAAGQVVEGKLWMMLFATRVDNYRPTGVVGVQCGSNVTTLPLASMTDTSTSVLPQLDRNLSLTSQPQSLAPLSDSESNVTGADHDDYTTPAEVRHNDRPGDDQSLIIIIAASASAGILLIIIAIVVIVVARRRIERQGRWLNANSDIILAWCDIEPMEKSDHVATPVAPPFGSAVVMVQRRPLPDQRQDVQRQRHIVAESVKNEQEVERKPRCDHNEKPTDVTGDVITPATTMHHVNFKRRNAYATAEHQPNERLMGMVQGPQNSRPPSQ